MTRYSLFLINFSISSKSELMLVPSVEPIFVLGLTMGIVAGFSADMLIGFCLTTGAAGDLGGSGACTRPLRVTRPISVILTLTGSVGMGFSFPSSIRVALYW